MSFLFSQPAPGVLPANSVDFSEVETIGASTLLGNKLGAESTIQELSVSDVSTLLNLGSLQPLDSDLTAIAGLSPANDDLIQRKAGVWTNRTPAQFKTDLSLTKSDVGLSNVDNTSDANKPISTATQSALNGKASTQLDNLGTTAINAHLLFNPDNTYDIGADGASRPSAIHAANHITVPLVRARDNDGLSQRHLIVRAGNSTTGNGDGGNLTVAAGLQNGSGTPGSLLLQSNGATRIELTSTGAINIPSLTASAFAGSNASKDLVSLSSSTATSYLDSFSGSIKGLVPASLGGTSNFLRADGQWQPAGVSTVAGDVYKVLASNGSTTTWQYAGLGDGSFPTNTVILGRSKPTSLTAQQGTIIGAGAANAAVTAPQIMTIGYQAGAALTDGGYNTLVGYQAGNSLTTGTQNTALGQGALRSSSVSVSDNTAIGRGALEGITTSYNTAVGQSAGNSNNTQRFTAVGWYAATNTVAAPSNGGADDGVFVGYNAWGTGTNGIAIGSGARIGTGSDNITIGKGSGRSSAGATGANNTVVGSDSFNSASLTTAFDNVIIGKGSGKAITVAQQHVIIGASCGTGVTSAYQSVLIGDHSAGNYNGIVAIGWKSSGSGVSGDNSVRVGFRGGAATNSVSVGDSAQTGSGGVAVGYNANANTTNSVAVGISANAFGATNSISIGNTAKTVNSTESIAIGYLSGGDSNGIGNYNTSIGAYAGGLMNASATRNINLGRYAGYRSTTQTDELLIDNQDRTTYANQQTKSIIYGVMNATETSQRLSLNAQVKLSYGEKHASLHGQTGVANVITATVNNYYIGVDSTLAAKTVNLPAVATAGQGFVLVIKDELGIAATNNITLQASGAENIDGANTKVINTNYGSISLMCSGSAWFVM